MACGSVLSDKVAAKGRLCLWMDQSIKSLITPVQLPMTDPWDERYIYLHERLTFMVNVGTCTCHVDLVCYIDLSLVHWDSTIYGKGCLFCVIFVCCLFSQQHEKSAKFHHCDNGQRKNCGLPTTPRKLLKKHIFVLNFSKYHKTNQPKIARCSNVWYIYLHLPPKLPKCK